MPVTDFVCMQIWQLEFQVVGWQKKLSSYLIINRLILFGSTEVLFYLKQSVDLIDCFKKAPLKTMISKVVTKPLYFNRAPFQRKGNL